MATNAREAIVASIAKSLPKPRHLSPIEWIFGLGGLLGTIISITTLFYGSPSAKELVGELTLALITLCLFGFLVAREMRGLDRYAQAIPHLHYAAHVTRDALSDGTKVAVDMAARRLIGSCAEVFSVVTGRICFATIKVVEPDGAGYRIREFQHDEIAETSPHGVRQYIVGGKDDYDFYDIKKYYSVSSIIGGDSAYCYVSNNIYKDFRRHRYHHPVLFNPQTGLIFTDVKKGFRWSEWPLAFRSTVVVPIRAIKPDGSTDLLGFLCVDCGSRNAFDPRLAPDMAGAYADLIFALYNAARDPAADGGAPPTKAEA